MIADKLSLVSVDEGDGLLASIDLIDQAAYVSPAWPARCRQVFDAYGLEAVAERAVKLQDRDAVVKHGLWWRCWKFAG